MASGNTVSGGSPSSYNAYQWYAYINATEVGKTDGTYTIRWTFGIASRYALQITFSAGCNGNFSGYLNVGNGWSYTTIRQFDKTYDRSSSDYSVSCSGWVSWSGFGGGTSNVTCTATVPTHTYYKPNAPKNLTVKRVSDSAHELSVELPENNKDWKDYVATFVYRHTDGGDTETLYNKSIVSSYRDATTSAGHKFTYDTRVKGRNGELSDMSNVVTVYTTPDALGSLEIAKLADNTVQLTGHDAPRYYDGFEFEVTKDNRATWSAATVDENWLDGTPPGGTIRYRARAYKLKPVNGSGSTLYGPWTESNEITTLCAPNAPLVYTNKSVFALGANGAVDVDVKIAPNHPDGTDVTARKVEYSVDSGAVKTANASSNTYRFTISGAHTYRVRACTKGVDEYGFGAWSTWLEFSTAYAPTGYFTAPGSDDFVLGELPFDVAWTAADDTGISHVDIALVDASGNTVASYSGDDSVSKWSINRYSTIDNDSSYTLRGTVRNGKGLETGFSRSFTTSWLTPAPPIISLDYNDDLSVALSTAPTKTVYGISGTSIDGPISLNKDGNLFMAGRVVIEDGEIEISNAAECASFDMARKNPDSSTVQLITGASVGANVFDRLPPLNTAYTYSVTAYAESGTFITFEVAARCDSFGDEAFNFGDAAETCLRLGYNANINRTKKNAGSTFHFARGRNGSPLPTFYPDGDLDIGGAHSYKVYGRDAYEKVERITDDPFNAVCWWRSAFGRIARVAVDTWGLDYSADDYSLWTISPSLMEVDWEDPVR